MLGGGLVFKPEVVDQVGLDPGSLSRPAAGHVRQLAEVSFLFFLVYSLFVVAPHSIVNFTR